MGLVNGVKKQDYHRPRYKPFQVIKLKSVYVIARFKINTNMTIKPLRDHFEQPLHCLKVEIGKFRILKTTCVFGHNPSLKNVNFFAALVKKKSLQNELFVSKDCCLRCQYRRYLEGEGTNQLTRVENTYLLHLVKRSIEIILAFE